MPFSLPVFTDRSRIEARQRCARLGYWQYEYCGRGLELEGAVPLRVGAAVHKGVEAMHTFHQLEEGLAAASSTEEFSLLFQEDQALVEALIRTWWAVGFPALREWQIHSVEQEETFSYHDVLFMSRSDWIASPPAGCILNGVPVAPGLYNWNLKTWKSCGERQKKSLLYDAQVFTELMGPERRLGKEFEGVIYQVLIKEDHPLVWAWRSAKDGSVVARYRWTCETAHENTHTKAGGWCPGGRQHRLGGDFERVFVNDLPGGQAARFNHIQETDPDLLREFHVILGPMSRPSDYVIEEWREQWLPREVRIAKLRSSEPLSERLLRRYFPKETAHGNCVYPSECPALKICWEGASPDSYEWRTPNHPEQATYQADTAS